MNIRVRLFAVLKEKIGCDEMNLDWTEGVKCGEVVSFFKQNFEELGPILEKSFVAINGTHASRDSSLRQGDEIALLPPVSGG